MRKLLLVLLFVTTALFGATDTQLDRAYAKEFAFMKAQKNMLTKRLERVTTENAQKLEAAKAELNTLQNSVLAKQSRSEKMNDLLYAAQQNAQNVSDDVSMVEAVVLQAQSALTPYGVKVEADKENYQAALKTIFEKSEMLIKQLSSIEVTKAPFYLNDGTEKLGTVVKVGNIARYGVDGSNAGALVPAGEGKFKLYDEQAAVETANAMAKAEMPDTLNIFIYENSTKEIEDKTEKTTFSVIDSGGIIGWVIVGLGAFGLLLAIFRSIFLVGSNATTASLPQTTLVELLEGGQEQALDYLKEKKGATARVLKATVRNLDAEREHVEDVVMESIMHESSRLDRFGSAIMVIAAVAPLLGLLGTVTGMIATFDIITEFGTGDPKLLSGGISIALVTTELGLIVAIPMLLVGNMLSAWAEKIKDAMEHSALHLINEYNKQK
ncbi:MAG: MotA/TolQ/ExbB proton channel family protein [Sulfurimonadaceae bacterium]